MFKYFLIPGFVLSSFFAHAQGNTSIKGPFTWQSKIYPGTERNYWVYVPKQYDASKPACVMIVQDGVHRAVEWNLSAVLDSLIAIKEIPVIVGIFIDPGTVPAATTDFYPRYNRSFEYDALGDRYARFLLEEMLPEVGRSYNLSKDPNDMSISGASSGAICAFNAAWERPDAFRRVFSTIGTYVGLRGGDEFATLVRKTEPKPLRVFLEDGDHDLNIYGGDWWMANQDMLSALTWAGYDVNHAWGTGGHGGAHGRAILTDALKWLWKDYPKPVTAPVSANNRTNFILDHESWKELDLKNNVAKRIAVDKSGQIFIASNQDIYKIEEGGKISEYAKLKGEVGGISFGADGRLYAGNLTQNKIVAFDEKGISTDITKGVAANFMAASTKGIYFSETAKRRVGFYSFDKKDVNFLTLPGSPTGLTLTAEQTFLHVAMIETVFGYSVKILENGKTDFLQEYTHYHIPYGSAFAGAQGMTADAGNVLYTSTSLGIQAADQLGRINFIFSRPAAGTGDVKFGGKAFDMLYAICDGKLFSRKVNAKGILSWLPAIKPTQPRM